MDHVAEEGFAAVHNHLMRTRVKKKKKEKKKNSPILCPSDESKAASFSEAS